MVRLNLVVIRSTDIDRASEFYMALGLKFDKHSHGAGQEHYACEIEGFVFEIYPLVSSVSPTTSTRIGFNVPSVDVAVNTLEVMGVDVLTPPSDSPWGRRAVVSDFDGHRVELVSEIMS